MVSPAPVPHVLETDRLTLRQRRVDDAVVHRQLWAERDPRVPPHRRMTPDGRPTVEEIAAQIRAEGEQAGLGLLAVERKREADVIGYCGLLTPEHGSADEAELVYELIRAVHGCGYATEAAEAVVSWASEAGYLRLWATVRDWNTASRRVAEKLGFTDTGRIAPDDGFGNTLLFVRRF